MKFEVVIGITPGNPLSWENPDKGLRRVKLAWIEAMNAEIERTGRVISAFMSLIDCIYPKSGIYGEPCVLIKGDMNQKFELCKVEWIESVKRVVEEVRQIMQQDNVLLCFEGEEQYYLTGDKE